MSTILIGCGSEPTNPPRQPTGPVIVQVEVSVSPDTVPPGATAVVRVSAESSGASLTSFELRITGLGDGTIELPIVPGAGRQSASVPVTTLRAPLEGVLRFTAVAGAGAIADSASTELTVLDGRSPTVSQTQTDLSLHPGTDDRVGAVATDDAGLVAVVARLSGAVSRTDSFPLDLATRWEGEVPIAIPDTARPGDSVRLDWKAIDLFGKVAASVDFVLVEDLRLPAVTVVLDSVVGGPFDADSVSGSPILITRSDTGYVTVSARDEFGLRSWGIQYKLGSQEIRVDTFPVTGFPRTISTIRPVTLWPRPGVTPDTWVFFADDSTRNRGFLHSSFPTFDGIRPDTVVLLPRGPGISRSLDFMYSPARERMYVLADHDRRIYALDVATAAWDTVIQLPTYAHAFDLTLSEDSLVVALEHTPYLGIVDLTAPLAKLDSVFVTDDHVWSVRVSDQNEAFVTTAATPPVHDVHIVSMTTGSMRRVANVGSRMEVRRSGDRSTIVFTVPGAGGTRVYRSGPDSIVVYPAVTLSPETVVNGSGTLFADGGVVYDAHLNPIRQSFGGRRIIAFSPDQLRWYQRGEFERAFEVVDVNSATLLQRILTPYLVGGLVVVPGRQQIIVTAGGPLVILGFASLP